MASFLEQITSKVQNEMEKLQNDSDPSNVVKPVNDEVPEYTTQVFQLPIEYVHAEHKYELSSVVASDLELVHTLDNSVASMYSSTCIPKTHFAQHIIPKFQKTYTTDTSFLLDTQRVVENMEFFHTYSQEYSHTYEVPCDTIHRNWRMVKHDPKFIDTYGYLEWDILKEYNKSSIVLQTLTVSNMLAPVMSFFIPILFLLFPFVLLKIQGIPISLSVYFKVLKDVARNHFIGQTLSIFESFSVQKLIYLIVMLALYGFQMYQNTMQCLRFYRNTQRMNEELCEWKRYRHYMNQQIEQFLQYNNGLESYKPFCQSLYHHQTILQELHYMLEPIQPFSCSITKTTEIGYMLKSYYEMHTDPQYEQTILYCMGFEGYLRCMHGVYNQWKSGKIHKAEFISDDDENEDDDDDDEDEDDEDDSNRNPDHHKGNTKKCYMIDQYYPPHQYEETCVKNDVLLDCYGVITGPNASGKTTYLKTTAINVILAQQFGFGFFKECKIRPYTHIHSYLNIPDTSGRDSLFQAESRRCKQILETIENNQDGHHFCIFDELYSGTNPKEATQAAFAFLQYLRQYKHVDLFLTTHYVSICDKWDAVKKPRQIKNYQMTVEMEKSKRVPTYRIEPGISRIEGAIDILTNMDYPDEMLELMETNAIPSNQEKNENEEIDPQHDEDEKKDQDEEIEV